MIPEDVIQNVIEQNDIVSVISESVRLKRSGRNYFGLCPFHNEKTPSFSVSSTKQIYKCFGCGEAGNVITFVMKTRRVSFPEAVKILANRVNIDVEDNSNKNTQKISIKDKVYAINVEAARYFFKNLQKNKKAMNYFLDRGISQKTIKKFGLGYALDSWNGILNYLKLRGYSELDMISAGIITKSPKGTFYDRFRNRVIFPVFDYRGRVIGFGGRVLDDSKPKYLNSPETVIFKKGINLYGLNFSIKNNKLDTFIIVEGYMDCISLHQEGFTNVVASLGTALTERQSRLLRRYADNVIIAYDADFAGETATLRGLDVLKKQGFNVKVLIIPEGKDPDDFIKSNGKEAFNMLIKEAVPLVDYRLNKAKDGLDIINNYEMKVKYIENAAEVLKDLDSIERAVYTKKVSEEIDIPEKFIYEAIKNKMRKNAKKHGNMNIQGYSGQNLYLEPSYLKAERGLLKLILKDKEALKYAIDKIQEDTLILESHNKIYKYIIENKYINHKEIRMKIESNLTDLNDLREWSNILALNLIYDEENAKNTIDEYLIEIKKFKLEESKKEIMNKIKQYELEGKIKESIKLAQQLIEIRKKLEK
ncbi:DNA primase [Clostridium acetireducens DSM 10703]|uniref:DNA primase n=1 Tax=Clostridium acetireducens DSM 10703 TaxID=1121290 RepID=A0A1E8F168_9CLOT|nr:DNA primase [Clostridium acetireducens]OFI07170.1 DNA primase [Clostridium acetireducens DSM 10703]